MTRPGRRLAGYADYIAHTDSDKKGVERQKVVRFAARWQLARGFDRIVMDGDRERRRPLATRHSCVCPLPTQRSISSRRPAG